MYQIWTRTFVKVSGLHPIFSLYSGINDGRYPTCYEENKNMWEFSRRDRTHLIRKDNEKQKTCLHLMYQIWSLLFHSVTLTMQRINKRTIQKTKAKKLLGLLNKLSDEHNVEERRESLIAG